MSITEKGKWKKCIKRYTAHIYVRFCKCKAKHGSPRNNVNAVKVAAQAREDDMQKKSKDAFKHQKLWRDAVY
jgi:hypothetical protein